MKSFLLSLTIPRLLVAIVFIAIFTMAVRVPADSDTWWHLRAGQYIVENRTIPTTDPFSHTKAGELWINHSWLAQIFWYGLYALGSWAAVALALATLVTIAFWFTWKQIEGNLFVAAFAMILGAIVSSVVWAARPQMISFVLAAIVEEQCLRAAFALIVARAKTVRIDMTPVVLRLGMHLGVTVHFAGGSLKDLGFDPLG